MLGYIYKLEQTSTYVKEKLLEYGFTCVSTETPGGVWKLVIDDNVLKIFVWETEVRLYMPKSRKMKKNLFVFKNFVDAESLIEKHICYEIMKL